VANAIFGIEGKLPTNGGANSIGSGIIKVELLIKEKWAKILLKLYDARFSFPGYPLEAGRTVAKA
jgi:hypothetical protein